MRARTIIISVKVSLLWLYTAGGVEAQELAYVDSIVEGIGTADSELTLSQEVDDTHDFHVSELVVPLGVIAAGAFCISTPNLVAARKWTQGRLSNATGQPTFELENFLQYAPMVFSYALYFNGSQGEHNLLDRTVLLATSYTIFSALNGTMKWCINEQRPNSMAVNSFPSGHSGTAFVGAEFLRREYRTTNKTVVLLGYTYAATTEFLRIYNNRHWFNDVIAGAALGTLSTSLAYWLYPKMFPHRHQLHLQELQRRQQPPVSWLASPYADTKSVGVAAVWAF